MRTCRYNEEDLLKVANREISVAECASIYGTTPRAVYNVLNRKHLTIRKVKVEIITPYQTKVCSSIEEASNELQCSTTTIKNALSGKRVPFLEKENIKVRRVGI